MIDGLCNVLFMGIQGPQLLREELQFIQKYRPAGLILFKRNISSPQQLRALNQEIKSLLSPPLLIAIDCEGGKVNRLAGLSLKYEWPSPKEMAKKTREQKKALFRSMAQHLKELFFDINFAPVVDWPLVQGPLLQDRVMGDSPESLLQNAKLFVQSFLSYGIKPCLKHFPGHGGVKEDSHKELPIDFRDFEEMKTQWDIFQGLLHEDLGIMTAHVQFPKMDKRFPASLSPFFLTTVLRKKMAFKGLIFSDDIDMQALKNFSVGECFFLALRAGCDGVLSCQDFQAPYQIVEYFKKNPKKAESLKKTLKKSQIKLLSWKNS